MKAKVGKLEYYNVSIPVAVAIVMFRMDSGATLVRIANKTKY